MEESRQPKTCRECGSADIGPGCTRARNWICRTCHAARYRKYKEEHPEQERARHRRYTTTVQGVAACLRDRHGLDVQTSREWAERLLDPDTTCAVCGIPSRILRLYNEKGPWPRFMGNRSGRGSQARLGLGHRVPGVNEGGFVPLCHSCNNTLSVETFTPEATRLVLIKVRARWTGSLGLRFLWWLHTDVDPVTGYGVGGKTSMTPAKARRNAEYRGGV